MNKCIPVLEYMSNMDSAEAKDGREMIMGGNAFMEDDTHAKKHRDGDTPPEVKSSLKSWKPIDSPVILDPKKRKEIQTWTDSSDDNPSEKAPATNSKTKVAPIVPTE